MEIGKNVVLVSSIAEDSKLGDGSVVVTDPEELHKHGITGVAIGLHAHPRHKKNLHQVFRNRKKVCQSGG